MDKINLENLIVSLVFHKVITIYDFQFTEEIFVNKNIYEYLIEILNKPDEIDIINANFVAKNKNFVFYKKESIIQFLEERSLKIIVQTIYKNSIERILKSIELTDTSVNVIDESLVAIEKLKSMISELSEDTHVDPVQQFKDGFINLKEKIKNNEYQDGIVGLGTDISQLDLITGGFQETEYVLLAGRPSMGKTSLALDIALTNALEKKSVLIFSIEMAGHRLISRLIPKYNNSLTLEHTVNGKDIENKYEEIMEAADAIANLDIEIEDFHDKNKVTILDIRKKLDKYYSENGYYPDLIIIDYIQIISDYLNRKDENLIVGEISRTLQRLGKQTNSVIIALSQLNRSLEDRVNKRPLNSDLRSSGSLEQDADKILFVYREEVYLEKKLQEALEKKPDSQEIADALTALRERRVQGAEIIVSKNRNGKVGTAFTNFLKESAIYSDDAENILLDIGRP